MTPKEKSLIRFTLIFGFISGIIVGVGAMKMIPAFIDLYHRDPFGVEWTIYSIVVFAVCGGSLIWAITYEPKFEHAPMPKLKK